MEKETKLFKKCVDIIENMEKKDFREIKSGLGLIEMSCTIVEESYNRLDMVSKSVEKKETAVKLMTPLLQMIKEKELITDHVENSIIEFLSTEPIEEMIDDLVITWRENLEEITYNCLWLVKLFQNNRRGRGRKVTRTRLSKITA